MVLLTPVAVAVTVIGGRRSHPAAIAVEAPVHLTGPDPVQVQPVPEVREPSV